MAIVYPPSSPFYFGSNNADNIVADYRDDVDDRIYALGGNDVVFTGRGDDLVFGGNGDDALYGDADNDDLRGEAGADTIVGGAGNDLLSGGAGSDQIYGGTGFDTAAFLDLSAPITVFSAGQNPHGRRYWADGQQGRDALYDIEKVIGTPHGDRFYGDQRDDRFDGGGGSDTFWASGGRDTYWGNEGWNDRDGVDGGYDEVRYQYWLEGRVKVDLEAGTIEKWSGDRIAAVDRLHGIDGVVGTNHNGLHGDVMIGGRGTDVLIGLDGSDVLVSNGGGGRLEGGDGGDRLFGSEIYDWSGDLRPSTAQLIGGGGPDVIVGSDAGETLRGGDGRDVLHGNGGNDLLDGGVDVDTARYDAAEGYVFVNLQTNRATGADGADTLSGIENVVIGDHGGWVRGDAGANYIGLGRGNDLAFGEGGDDLIIGGNGNDNIDGGAGNDRLEGGKGADTLRGNAGDDRIDATEGGDVAYAHGGSDTVIIGRDARFADGGSGVDWLQLDDDGMVWMRNRHAFVDGGQTRIENFENIAGSIGADIIGGNELGNTLDGKGGADILIGYGGGDIIHFDMIDEDVVGDNYFRNDGSSATQRASDRFVYQSLYREGSVEIEDFDVARGVFDVLDLRAAIRSDPARLDGVRVWTSGDAVTIVIPATGERWGDKTFKLKGVAAREPAFLGADSIADLNAISQTHAGIDMIVI